MTEPPVNDDTELVASTCRNACATRVALPCPVPTTQGATDLIFAKQSAVEAAEALLGRPLAEDCTDVATGEPVTPVVVTDNGPPMKSVAVARWFAAQPHLAHVRTRHRARTPTASSNAGSRHQNANTSTAMKPRTASTSPTISRRSGASTTRSALTRPSTSNDPSTPTDHSNRTRRKLSRKPDPGQVSTKPGSTQF